MAELERWGQTLEETAEIISVVSGEMGRGKAYKTLQVLSDVNRNEL